MSKRDRFFLFFFALSFAASSYLFFRRETYNLQTKIAEQIGSLISFENEVKHKQVASIDWQQVTENNMDLLAGDQLFTSEDASAVVKLTNGVVLNLKPNTLVKLELNDDNLNLNYLKGLMEIDFSKSELEGKNIKINGQDLKGEKAKLKIYQQNDKTLFNVQEGKINLGDKSLKAGEELDGDGKKRSADEIITLLGPEDNLKFSPLKREQIKFKWKSPRGQKILTLEISRDPDFDNYFLQKKLYTDYFYMKMPRDGRYYWRVRAPGITSPVAYFTVRNLPPAKLLYPRVEEQLKVKLKQRLPVEFAWEGDPNQEYLVTLYSPNEGRRMTKKTFKTTGTSYEAKLSDLGRYLWEVKPAHPKGVKSKRRSFRLRPNEFVKVKLPGKNFVFDATRPNRGINFELLKAPRSRSILYVSRDVTFEEVVLAKKFNTQRFNVKFSKAGEYYYKIKSTEDDNYTTDVYEMTVINWTAVNMFPGNDTKIKSKKLTAKVDFKWTPLYKGRVMFELSKDSFFRDVIMQKLTKQPLMAANLPPGKYYWRIRPTDPNIGDYWKVAQPKLFEVDIPKGPFQAKLAAPDIFADEDRSNNNKEAYVYNIPNFPNTVKYIVEVKNYGKLNEFETRSPKVRIEGSHQGVWEYRYKVIDKWGRKSNYSKWGKIVFPIAPNY